MTTMKGISLPKAPLDRLAEAGARRLRLALSTEVLRSFKNAPPIARPSNPMQHLDRENYFEAVATITSSRTFQRAAVLTLAGAIPQTLRTEPFIPDALAATDHVISDAQPQANFRSTFLVFLAYAGSLALGATVGMAVPPIGRVVVSMVDAFMAAFVWVSPAIIFSVVAPAFAHVFNSRQGHQHGWITMKGFLSLKLAACLAGAVATAVLLQLPLLAGPVDAQAGRLLQPLKDASWNFVANPMYWGIYLAILTGRLARNSERLTFYLDKGASVIETFGEKLEPFIPAFLIATGVYIVSLPGVIAAAAGGGAASVLQPFQVLGLSLNPSTPAGMVGLYIYGSILVALVCWAWHLVLLVGTALIEPRFKIKDYFTRYWNTVYALLWSTSSERLSQPVSLHRAKIVAPWVPGPLRQLVIGLGTSTNINGTIICVFVLAGVVGRAVGADIGLIHLLIAVPMVYMISLAAPGIPGELVLFAGPLVAAVGMPPEQAAPFLALYLGLQLGLPDSFRTGTNSTDDLLCAVAFNAVAERAGVSGRQLEGQHRTAA